MNNFNIVITSASDFENIISRLENSLLQIKTIFENEVKNNEKINKTEIWTGKTQEAIYEKNKKLQENYSKVEEALQNYITFLKQVISEYKLMEQSFSSDIVKNNTNLDVTG